MIFEWPRLKFIANKTHVTCALNWIGTYNSSGKKLVCKLILTARNFLQQSFLMLSLELDG